MLVKMLRANSIDALSKEVIDNNCIDRLVTMCRPRVVVIEALWVVPSKLELLKRLHPNTQWIVRLHSNLPFIAGEGIAIEWITAMAKMFPKVEVAANNQAMCRDLSNLLDVPIRYLPNHYAVEMKRPLKCNERGVIDISCFGAIRPLKNQLIQAVAAITYADMTKQKLRFHINGTRVESNGNAVLKNIRALFPDDSKHSLIEHAWLDYGDFKKLISTEIDLGMQLSYTETFNIVAADHIDCGVPVVVSDEVLFVDSSFKTDPNSTLAIIRTIGRALSSDTGARRNRRLLQKSNDAAEEIWKTAFNWDRTCA
jgi:glycosyltransferase involved in cell wall biosynthesis